MSAATGLGSATHPASVRLRVRDLTPVADFYRRALGLSARAAAEDGVLALGVAQRTLVELESAPDARPAERGTAGLFHLALLVPDRAALADAIARVVGAGHGFSGASDHLVSEALYLNDPEGNGIEIYRDRPRDDWPRSGERLEMDTLPLDIEAVMAERRPGETPAEIDPATVMGHVHLRVDDLARARRFYVGLLGMDATVEHYPGALFVSAGGYHHHFGLNTWMSNRPASAGALGLAHHELVVDSPAVLATIEDRLSTAGHPTERREGLLATADPAGNRLLLRAAV